MPKMNTPLNFVITPRTILITFFLIAAVYFAYIIKSTLILIFISLIFALALEPFVEFLKKKKIPHGIAVLTVGVLFFGSLLGMLSIAVAPLLQQIRTLMTNLPFYMQSIASIPFLAKYSDQIVGEATSKLGSSSDLLIVYTVGAFSSLMTILLTFVLTIYILLDFANLRNHFVSSVPFADKDLIRGTLNAIESRLKDWLRGQIVLMLIIGTVSYVGLYIVGLGDYALALAVFAGILEAVPVIGPMIAVIPAAIIGFTFSPALGISIIILYTLIQQLENNFIVPKIMQRAVGFNPLVTIIAFIVGAELMGVMGAIISLPVLIIITEIFKAFYSRTLAAK
jgi:predicted PurR-regulated permease PerM